MASAEETATRRAASTDDERLPLKTCLSFGVGTVGVSVLLNSVAAYFQAMMVTVFGVSPAVAGYLLTGSKLYDIGADLVIGSVSDRTRSPWGRRRPYILAGSIISTIAFAMLFVPPVTEGAGLIIYSAIILIVYSTGYSLFNIPYLAMPAEMVKSPPARTHLLSYRTLFVSVGQLISVTGAAALINYYGGGRTGYAIMGCLLAVVILVTTLTTFFGTASSSVSTAGEPRKTEKVNVFKQFARCRHNKPFLLLMATKLCMLLGMAASSGVSLLFFLNVLKVGYAGQIYMTLAGNLSMALSLLVWVRVIRKIGKRNTYLITISSGILMALTWLGADVGEPMGLIALRGMVSSFFGGGTLLVGIAMLTDVMDYDARLTGERREGVYSSVYAIVEKVAYAIGPAAVGFYLSASGYIATKGGQLVQQPESVIRALYVGQVWLPVCLLSLGFIFMLFYRIDETPAKPATA